MFSRCIPSNLSPTALIAVWMMTASVATAQTVLYDINFSAPKHTLNATPARGGTDGISRIAFGAPKVVSGFGPLTDRPLLFTGSGNPYDQIELWGIPTAAIYQLDFDLVTELLKDSGFRFTILFDSPTAHQFSLDGTTNKIDLTAATTWQEGQAIHFTVTANYMTNRWTARMDDVVVFDSAITGKDLKSIRFNLGPKSLTSPVNGAIKVALDNVRVVTTAPPQLEPPGQFTATGGLGKSSINLSWAQTYWAQWYSIYRGETDEFSSSVFLANVHIVNPRQFSDQSIQPGKQYYYWVKAEAVGLQSESSSMASARVDLLPPASLTVAAMASGDGIRLAWPASNLATGYSILKNTTESIGSASHLTTTSDLEFVDTSVVPGVRYYYWVRSIHGPAASTGVVSGGAMLALLPADGLTATMDQYSGRIRLDWNPVNEAIRYTVFRSLTGRFGDATALGDVSVTDYWDTSSVNGQDYTYWIVPFSSDGTTAAPSDAAEGRSSDGRPDLSIRLEGGAEVGAGIVGDVWSGQTATVVARDRNPVEAMLSIRSLGAANDEVRLYGQRGNRRFDVAYGYRGNATAAMLAGRLVVASGDQESLIFLSVRPKLSMRLSQRTETIPVLVTGTSLASPSNQDVVVLRAVSLPRRPPRTPKPSVDRGPVKPATPRASSK